MSDDQISLDTVRGFLIEHNGKCTRREIASHFLKEQEEGNESKLGHILNILTTVSREENGEQSIHHLADQYRSLIAYRKANLQSALESALFEDGKSQQVAEGNKRKEVYNILLA